MGVGRTVYKGEVKTGVFAWFLSRTGLMPVIQKLRNPCGSELARDEGVSVNNKSLTYRHREQARSHRIRSAEINSN